MRRDEIWNAVTLKARAIYHGTEYEVIGYTFGYTYKNLTFAREAIILKDRRANSIIEAPIADVELAGEYIRKKGQN